MNNKNELDNDDPLQEKLKEVKNQEGITGYIFRSSNSAAIDLKNPQKIIDYAMLSSAILSYKSGIPCSLNLLSRSSFNNSFNSLGIHTRRL